MSNLRLISETSGTSVSSISVTDVFNADFDTYKVIIKNVDSTAENYTYMRFINASGNIITATNYNYAAYYLRSYTTNVEVRSTGDDEFTRFGVQNTGASDGGSTVTYIHTPFPSTSYTWFSNQHSAQGSLGQVGIKGIGAYRDDASFTGMQFYPASGTFDTITVQVYGLRVD